MESATNTIRSRLVTLQATKELIEQAIALKDGTAQTMREIISLLEKRGYDMGETFASTALQTSPLKKGVKLNEETKETYLKLLFVIQREIIKLQAKPATDALQESWRSHNGYEGDLFERQAKHFAKIKTSIQRQSFWKSNHTLDRMRKSAVRALIDQIETGLKRREALVPMLMKSLKHELSKPF